MTTRRDPGEADRISELPPLRCDSASSADRFAPLPPLSEQEAVAVVEMSCEPLTILQIAERVVNGDRNDDYDHPFSNFMRIAVDWTAWLRGRGLLREGQHLDARDVAHLNIGQKRCREMYRNKPDNQLDIVSYLYALEKAERMAAARYYADRFEPWGRELFMAVYGYLFNPVGQEAKK